MEIVEKYFEYLRNGDLAGMLEIFADDARVYSSTGDSPAEDLGYGVEEFYSSLFNRTNGANAQNIRLFTTDESHQFIAASFILSTDTKTGYYMDEFELTASLDKIQALNIYTTKRK